MAEAFQRGKCAETPSLNAQTKKAHLSESLFAKSGVGTRRTVAFGETRFPAGLEVGCKFGIPQPVTINKSASYGLQWNRIGIAPTG